MSVGLAGVVMIVGPNEWLGSSEPRREVTVRAVMRMHMQTTPVAMRTRTNTGAFHADKATGGPTSQEGAGTAI